MGIPQNPRELAGRGVKIAASTIWEILKTNGVEYASAAGEPSSA